jgi:DNA-directed RNA polymerase sigma subunit (sigma70/sigma32)
LTRHHARRDNNDMRTFLWPAEDGWPYPDTGPEVADPQGEVDEDLLDLHARSPRLFAALDAVERQVITRHYGLDGAQPCSMKQLHNETGMSRAELREALGSGLGKLRMQLGS